VLDQRERDRYTAYAANEAFYSGDPSAQLTQLSTVKRDEVRAVFNYARDIINKHAAATVNGLECHAKDATSQAELDDALSNSGSFTADFSAVLNGCIYGDAAFYVSHDAGEVFYRPIYPGDADVLEWTPAGKPLKVMVQLDDRIETWSPTYVQVDVTGSDPVTYANPYGCIPVVIFPNWPRPGSRWGDSTIEHIKAACRLLNERLDLLMWLVRVQGNPPIKALGVDSAMLRTDPGEIWSAPAEATIDLVKLLDAETAGLHISTINLLLQIVKEISSTPSIAYGIGSANLSGRALELAYMPMTQAAQIRRGFLTDAIRQRNRVILRMCEVLHARRIASYETTAQYSEVVPADMFAARDQDRQDVQLQLMAPAVYKERYNS
jgi:hypothetical protein